MGKRTLQLGILYADICNSVRLYESLGDERAQDLVHDCVQHLIDISREHASTVIKNLGDGVMSSFDTADTTFDAAVEMQDTYHEGPLTIAVAFNFGAVIEEGGDIYGDAVNLAARIAALARSGETLLTGETVKYLSPHHRKAVRQFDTRTVRGRSKPVRIYAICHDETRQSTVMAFTKRPRQNIQLGELTLAYGGNLMCMGEAVRSLVIGRDKRCDLVVRGDSISRRHAVIEAKSDRYVLTDCSSNGTFVVTQDNREVYLKRESLPLLGRGTISPGVAPSVGASHTIRFAHHQGR